MTTLNEGVPNKSSISSTLSSFSTLPPSPLQVPALKNKGSDGGWSNGGSHNGNGSTRASIIPLLLDAHPIVDSSEFGSEDYNDEKNNVLKSSSITARRSRRSDRGGSGGSGSSDGSSSYHDNAMRTGYDLPLKYAGDGPGGLSVDTGRKIKQNRSPYSPEGSFPISNPPHSFLAGRDSPASRPKLEKAGPYLFIAVLQAYTILTVVRCLAEPTWIVLKTSSDKSGGTPGTADWGKITHRERWFLGCAIVFTLMSCLGVTLRIVDRMAWLRKAPVISAYFQAAFCIAALSSFLRSHTLPPDAQYSHGFLACAITVGLSIIVMIMLTIDWWRGFPSPGLSATLKALIVSSFMMTIVIIIGAAIYTWLEKWTFDEAVNFCIVSFSTIGYGNLSPKSVAGRVFFFFYGLLGISSIGFFIVSLRNAVIEQFQWRLLERFSRPAHMTRVQTRMSTKDLSYPMARLEEEQRVKMTVKRKMIIRMVIIWIVLWFGGAGVFCAFETWTFLESLYFCYVTLTTIGFGDYVPMEPGSIEFWNIYVFVGLTIFAYILSLFSESMASHIHLVDDEEGDRDEELYSWERCESRSGGQAGSGSGDFNAPLITDLALGGGILRLDHLKWTENQRTLHPLQAQDMTEVTSEGQPGLESNQECRPARQGASIWDSGAGVAPHEARYDSDAVLLHQQQQQQQQQLRYRAQRRSSVGRVLKVSSKERKQMLQAEYYATHGGPPNDSANNISIQHQNEAALENNDSNDHDEHREMAMAPATIKFVDMYGVPHQRRIRRCVSMVPNGGQRRSTMGSIGSACGSSISAFSSTPFQQQQSQLDQQQQRLQGGYVYGTDGYHDALTNRRRGTLADLPTTHILVSHEHAHAGHESQLQRRSTISGSNHEDDDGEPRLQGYSGSGMVTPQQRDSGEETMPDLYHQTSVLRHQPQVKFESPNASPRYAIPKWVPQQGQQGPGPQEQQQGSMYLEDGCERNTMPSSGSGHFSTRQDSLGFRTEQETMPSHEPSLGSQGGLKIPWPEEPEESRLNTLDFISVSGGSNNNTRPEPPPHMASNDIEDIHSDPIGAQGRYLEPENSEASDSIDPAKVISPPPMSVLLSGPTAATITLNQRGQGAGRIG